MSAFLTTTLALRAHLLAMTGLPDTIGYEGVVLEPVPDVLHLRLYDLPASSESLGIGANAGELDTGLYQVSIFDRPGKGTGVALALADRIKDQFKRSRITSGAVVVQCGMPRRGPVLTEGGFIQIPVTVPYTVTKP